MIASPIVKEISNSKFCEVSLNQVYFLQKVGTLKIDNDLVYKILSKIFMDMDAYVNVKQRKSSKLQNQRKSCKFFIMMGRRKGGIEVSFSHSTRNST